MHESIIDAAERLLDRFGYAKMTMTDLADEAGIGVGTIYLYFPGKADVALAVLERLHDRIHKKLHDISESDWPAGQKIREMLKARILLRFESARSRQNQIDEFKRAVQSAVAERRTHWLETEVQILAAALKQGRDAGDFTFDDAQCTAEILMRATSCMTPKNLTPDDFDDPGGVEQKLYRLIEFLLRGLLTTVRSAEAPQGGD